MRGRKLGENAQLARRLVDAPDRFQRPRSQPARRAPSRQLGAQCLGSRERVGGGALREPLPGGLQPRLLRSGHRRLGPVEQRPRTLLVGDAVEQFPDAPRLLGIGLQLAQRRESLARLRRAPHRSLEIGDAQGKIHAAPGRRQREGRRQRWGRSRRTTA